MKQRELFRVLGVPAPTLLPHVLQDATNPRGPLRRAPRAPIRSSVDT